MTISLDCGWDDALMAAPEGVGALVNAVDAFLPNESEFAALAKAGVEIGTGTLLVVKCGANGAWANSPDGRLHAGT
ncbi:MAG TPA: hypothetical protein ENK28_06005 [Aliiroseovarius sp.]|nr:hypothetical protein [Aliiroseovarius sp.]